LAELLAFGLIRASFVPPAPIQEMRDLTRVRTQLVHRIGQETLRVQKVLEDANIKIAGVVTDILGISGRAILRALIEGETNPERLLARTTGRLKAPRERLLAGLLGRVTDHHRFLLRFHLGQIESDEAFLAEIQAEIARVLEPFRRQLEQLITIPGVSAIVAAILIGEIGVDMGRFPSDGHLVSWAGLCPSMDESAGRRRSTRIRPGDPWLKTALVQSAWAAVRVKDTDLRSQFLRLRSRRGPKKAIIAVAASILTAVYHMLTNDLPYHDLGANHLDRLDKTRTARRLVHRLEQLGYSVNLTAAA
jgi:transposase